MRTVLLQPDESFQEWYEQRRAWGGDYADEMWEGVLHVVPPAGGPHQVTSTRLAAALLPSCEEVGLTVIVEVGLYDPDAPPDHSWRVPDITVAAAEHLSRRGVEGVAAFAVEIRSPWDESWQKLDYYARVGVAELLIVDLDPWRLDLLVSRDGSMQRTEPDGGGWFRSSTIPFAFRLDDDDLAVRGPHGERSIPLGSTG